MDPAEIKAAVAQAVADATKDLVATMKQPTTNNAGPALDAARKQAQDVRSKLAADRLAATDPHKGKALDFARVCRSIAMASLPGSGLNALQAAKQLGYQDVAEKMEAHAAVSKALGEGTGAAGGHLVPVEFSTDFIELLQAKAVVRRMGATTIPMNRATMDVPRQATAASASYVAENDPVAPSEPSFGKSSLTARKLMALTVVSNDLIRDGAINAEGLVRDDLLRAMALKEDAVFIRSNVADTPQGIRYQVDAGNLIVSLGSTTDNIIDTLIAAMSAVESADVPMDGMGWILHPSVKAKLASLRYASGQWVFKDEISGPNPTLFGFPVALTTQIPNNLGVGTDESEVYFGSFPQAVIGENTSLEIAAYPGGHYEEGGVAKSGISRDQTVITVLARHDFLLRHDQAFAVITGTSGWNL